MTGNACCLPGSRIAVIGAGIAGLGAAWALDRSHNVTLYEASEAAGGHACTVDVALGGRRIPVDTGFIVYNEANYPNLVRLFDTLDVATMASDMSFAFSSGDGRIEYAGSFRGTLGNIRNAMCPAIWRMTYDVMRFYRTAPHEIGTDDARSLRDYLAQGRYSAPFVRDHLLPMAAAIWSSSVNDVMDMPAAMFLRFFANHGLLRLSGRPHWRTVDGGSREYVRRLLGSLRGVTRLGTQVASVRRLPGGVVIEDTGGRAEHFDHAVMATHADQALAVLADASGAEKVTLGAFRYRTNRAVLHQDERFMPRRRALWASWNYLADKNGGDRGTVTYWMNRLQNIDRSVSLFVTLNPQIEPARGLALAERLYDHPQFDDTVRRAQSALRSIQGVRRTWFCGSYCGNGFHEDGLSAGLAVAAALGAPDPWSTAAPRTHRHKVFADAAA